MKKQLSLKRCIVMAAMMAMVFFLLCSCSDDTTIDVVGGVANCSDGIQNGNETGIDCGWVCSNTCEAKNGLEGHIVARVILDNTVEYKLTGPLIIRDGGELEIREGTIIKAQKDANAYISVAQGGKLYIYGKPDAPVIITSDADNPAPGDWGGIVICGKAPTNRGENARSALGDLFYGGNELEDSSGTLQYLRVEYTGASFEETTTFNGITFFGAGAFTNLEHVQSYQGKGNGFAFYGGNINPKWLIASNHQGNGVAITDGWTGNAASLYLSTNATSGIRTSNNETDVMATPLTAGAIKNVSIIGPVSEGALLFDQGGGIGTIDSLYTNSTPLGIKVDGPEATSKIDTGEWQVNTIQFDTTDEGFSVTNYTGPNVSFYSEGLTSGSGNNANFPDWAMGWARED
ncbi:MAG: hypothetical protein WBM98_08505 [Maribacter sp.]|uniref:hypothetical protein n=1 Tax=Maribacter sp. TaxID=1897614 RepID=UPI003C72AEC4